MKDLHPKNKSSVLDMHLTQLQLILVDFLEFQECNLKIFLKLKLKSGFRHFEIYGTQDISHSNLTIYRAIKNIKISK